jgi:hypothetical protein
VKYKALVIDPDRRTVEPCEFDYSTVTTLLGCIIVCTCRVAVNAQMMLDDSGIALGKTPWAIPFDEVKRFGYRGLLYGRAVMYGLDGPVTTDVPVDVEFVRSRVRFAELAP